jgi:hypothetical protein
MAMTNAARLRACGTLAFCATALLTGCAGNGEGLDESGRPEGENGSGAPGAGEFQQIQDTIFTPICTNCHAGASAPAGLRLDAGNSYAMLVNVASAEQSALMRVEPGDAENSYLVQKIEGRAAVGARMPLGGPPLSQENIDLVRSWIAGGAVAPASAGGSDVFSILSTVPAEAEASLAPVEELRVVFNSDVDASLVTVADIHIEASGGDSSFTDGNEHLVALTSVRIAAGNPRVLLVRPATPLVDDDFRLVIGRAGGVALADFGARVLDGDQNGHAGGDFTLSFKAVEEAR